MRRSVPAAKRGTTSGWRGALFSAVVIGAAGCESPTPPAVEEPEVCPGPVPAMRVDPAPLPDMSDSLIWYRGTPLQEFDTYPQDSAGVIMFEYDGAWYYHPIQMAQRGMWFAENYRRTADERYLQRAVAHADRLLAESVLIDGVRHYPYGFAYRLHNRQDDVTDLPWYSGMAQSQILSLLLRLEEMTGTARYMDAAHETMAAFHRLMGEAEPAIARVDCAGYYWIEEYPRPVSTRTLNGFIFGVFGVYEYWRRTGDEEANRLVRASLATLKHYLPEYRVPGGVSYYCLKHRAQITVYHQIHIEQLLYLHRMTGDPYFADFKALLESDIAP